LLFSSSGNVAWIKETVPRISVSYPFLHASSVSVTLIELTFDTTTSIRFSFSTISVIQDWSWEGMETSTTEPEIVSEGWVERKRDVAWGMEDGVREQK
jgi:hypothetical protein